jgi:hypothetical protein
MDSETSREQVLSWISRGKQVGKDLWIERSGRRFYFQVAIQKKQSMYKVIVDEIDEKLMAAEVFEREEERTFTALDDAIAFIESTTPVKLADLQPSKGQKWF